MLIYWIAAFFDRRYYIIVKKKECSPVSRKSDSSDNGQWADLIRRRNSRLSELKREFIGWQGTHEQHCILHDVLTNWWPTFTFILTEAVGFFYFFYWKSAEKYIWNKGSFETSFRF